MPDHIMEATGIEGVGILRVPSGGLAAKAGIEGVKRTANGGLALGDVIVEVDGVNVKLAKCGGVGPARRMLARARELGFRTFLGCMEETSVGIAGSAAVAGPKGDCRQRSPSLALMLVMTRSVVWRMSSGESPEMIRPWLAIRMIFGRLVPRSERCWRSVRARTYPGST